MRCLYAKAVFGEEEKKAVADALENGWLGEGKKVREFEDIFKGMTGKPYAVSVNSGSSANFLAIKSLDLPEGTGVVTPALTFNTVVSPIVMNGLVPVFMDVDPRLFVASLADVSAAVASSPVLVSAVMIPHLIGNCAEIAEIADYCRNEGLKLIEDCCDTVGSRYDGRYVGSFGDAATHSFYASHHVTAAGGGGMVLFKDAGAYETAISFRDWGRGDVYAPGTPQDVVEDIDRRFTAELDGIMYDQKFFYRHAGINMKMIELEAAFGVAQMRKLETFNAKREENFSYLVSKLSASGKLLFPRTFPKAAPSWLAFPVLVDGLDRNALVRHLEKNGIQTRMIFSGNITRHLPYRRYLKEFPGADCVMRDGFLVGAHHGMGKEECDHIISKIEEFIV